MKAVGCVNKSGWRNSLRHSRFITEKMIEADNPSTRKMSAQELEDLSQVKDCTAEWMASKDYDDEYPALEDSVNECIMEKEMLPNVEEDTSKRSNQSSNSDQLMDSRVISVMTKSLPSVKGGPSQLIADLKKKVIGLGGQLSVTRLPSRDYSLVVKAPRGDPLAVAVSLVEKACCAPIIVKRLKVGTRRLSLLAADNFEGVKRLLPAQLSKSVEFKTVPGTQLLTITGTNSEVSHCVKVIEEYLKEMSSGNNSTTVLREIHQRYHSLLRGAFGSWLAELLALFDGNVDVQIPPPAMDDRCILVTGPEAQRSIVCRRLIERYRTVRSGTITKIFKVPCLVHNNVRRACGLEKILKETGVSVSLPHEVEGSDSVIFVGYPYAIPEAVHLVLARNTNYTLLEIPCPRWVYRVLRQRPSCSFADLKELYKRSWVSYLTSKDCIIVDGPTEEVESIQALYLSEMDDINKELYHKAICVPAEFGAYLRNDGRAILDKLAEATETTIEVGDDDTTTSSLSSLTLNVLGSDELLTYDAVRLIEEFIEKLMEPHEHFEEIDSLLFPYVTAQCINHSLPDHVREKFGSKVKVTVKQLKNRRLTIVSLQGIRGVVFGVRQSIRKLFEITRQEAIVHQVHVPAAYHPLLVGKKGQVKKELISNSGVDKIFVPGGPANTSNSRDDDVFIDTPPNCVLLVGSQQCCQLAETLIKEKCDITVELDELELSLPSQLIQQLRVGNGFILRRVVASCVNAMIEDNEELLRHPSLAKVFLPNDPLHPSKNIVKVHGIKIYVQAVADQLLHYAVNNCFYVEQFCVDPSTIKMVVGKGGAQLKKFTHSTSVKIIVPSGGKNTKGSDSDTSFSPGTIFMMGESHDEIINVKTAILKLVDEVKDFVEKSVDFPHKFLKKLLTKDINDESPLSQLYTSHNHQYLKITLPKEGETGPIMLRGSSAVVESLCQKLNHYAATWNAAVREEFILPHDHIAMLKNTSPPNFASISAEFEVIIKCFRDTDKNNNNTNNKQQNPSKKMVLEGLLKNVSNAKAKIIESGPLEQIFVAPKQFHGMLIGTKGSELKKITEGTFVTLRFPDSSSESNDILVRGPRHQNTLVMERLQEVLDAATKKHEEWVKTNHSIDIGIPSKYLSKFIGKGGQKIKTLKSQLRVSIIIPKLVLSDAEGVVPPAVQSQDGVTKIIIRGEKHLCEKARETLLNMFKEWEQFVEHQIHVQKVFHGKLRGSRSVNMIRLQKKHRVLIRFAPIDQLDNDSITISGLPDNVKNAVDSLMEIASQLTIQAKDDEAAEDDQMSETVNSLDQFHFSPRYSKENELKLLNSDNQRSTFVSLDADRNPTEQE